MKFRPPLLALLAGAIVTALFGIALALIFHGSSTKDDQLIMAVIGALGTALATLGVSLTNLISRELRGDREKDPP
jgi:hypothetical protein